MSHNLFNSLQSFDLGNGKKGQYYSLPALESAGVGAVSKLPVSIRLVLESILRNCDGKKVSEAAVRELANWKPNAERIEIGTWPGGDGLATFCRATWHRLRLGQKRRGNDAEHRNDPPAPLCRHAQSPRPIALAPATTGRGMALINETKSPFTIAS